MSNNNQLQKEPIGPLKYPKVTLQDINSVISRTKLFGHLYKFYVPINLISFSNKNVVKREIWVSDDEQFSINSDIVTIIIHSSRYVPKKVPSQEKKPLGAFISFQFRNDNPPKYFMRRKNGIRSRYSSKQSGFFVTIQDFNLVYKPNQVPKSFVSLKEYFKKPKIRRKRSWKPSQVPSTSSTTSKKKTKPVDNSKYKRKKLVKKINTKEKKTSKKHKNTSKNEKPKNIPQSPNLNTTQRHSDQTSSPVINEFVNMDNHTFANSPQIQLLKNPIEDKFKSTNLNQKSSLNSQFLFKDFPNQEQTKTEVKQTSTFSSSSISLLPFDEMFFSIPNEYQEFEIQNNSFFDFDLHFDEPIEDFKLSFDYFMEEQPINLDHYSFPKSNSTFFN
ncbi:hypothetical protein M0813_01388 [Anaeramoeba flamelloides]|uniref:Uncharacterized protein n=1 Tax=Anaeramoeba flamelloides TaxID=1746091 RepID=A0ABQ8Z8Y0_9EUKA|nr:hypothetical protein M0813_01388 [Anaeramoeba flamelloides]